MAQRRSSADWSTKTYKGPLWKVFHPGKYLRSEYRKAKRAMHPGKVFLRVTSLDEVVKLGRTTTTRVNATTRQADLQRATKKAASAQKKTAAKKTAAKRPDPYQVAAGIPERNRRSGAQMMKAAQPGAKKKTYVQGRDGKMRGSKTFDGSKTMNERDLAAWQRAQGGRVDPVLLPRTPRRRG